MNGLKPNFLWLDYSWSEDCPRIGLLYELPVFHEYGTEWKRDGINHWHECSCGAKDGIAAHSDANGDQKCDVCAADFTVTAPGNTPGNTAGNTPGDPNGDKDGIGAGAIIGIIVGAAIVLGGGGFALYWFVLKKPTVPTDPVPGAEMQIPEETPEAQAPEDTAEENADEEEKN